jgi:hypothetical protein
MQMFRKSDIWSLYTGGTYAPAFYGSDITQSPHISLHDHLFFRHIGTPNIKVIILHLQQSNCIEALSLYIIYPPDYHTNFVGWQHL